MGQLFIKLLSITDSHPLHEPYNISPFMLKHFPKPEYKGGNLIGWKEGQEQSAKTFLEQIRERGYVEYDKKVLYEKISFLRLKEDNSLEFDKWFDNTEIQITFTMDGLNYLNQYRLNENTERNFKAQKNGLIATIVIAFLTVVVSGIGVYFTIKNDGRIETLQKQIKALQEHKEQLLSIPNKSENQKASETGLSHKSQPSSLDTLQTTYQKNKKATK